MALKCPGLRLTFPERVPPWLPKTGFSQIVADHPGSGAAPEGVEHDDHLELWVVPEIL